LIPNPELSVKKGVFDKFANTDSIYLQQVMQTCKALGIDVNKPFRDWTESEKNQILYGTNQIIDYKFISKSS